jgi:hypothetical protein
VAGCPSCARRHRALRTLEAARSYPRDAFFLRRRSRRFGTTVVGSGAPPIRMSYTPPATNSITSAFLPLHPGWVQPSPMHSLMTPPSAVRLPAASPPGAWRARHPRGSTRTDTTRCRTAGAPPAPLSRASGRHSLAPPSLLPLRIADARGLALAVSLAPQGFVRTRALDTGTVSSGWHDASSTTEPGTYHPV